MNGNNPIRRVGPRIITKNRILLLKEYLEKYSDEQHPVRTGKIHWFLEESVCPVTVQTLQSDIQSLLASGYEIEITEAEGMPTRYGWISRESLYRYPSPVPSTHGYSSSSER